MSEIYIAFQHKKLKSPHGLFLWHREAKTLITLEAFEILVSSKNLTVK